MVTPKNGFVNGGSRDGGFLFSELDVISIYKTESGCDTYSTEQYKKSNHFWIEDCVRSDWYEWDLL